MTLTFSSDGVPASAFVLANAVLVLPDHVVRGSLHVREGRINEITIDEIGVENRVDANAFDLGGDYLLPGLVEIHTDHLDGQLLPRVGAVWPPPSAIIAHDVQLIGAGITTALDAITLGDLEDRHPRNETLIDCIGAFDAARAHNLLRVDHWLHLRCELAHPELPAIARMLAGNARVRLLSLMDHTPGQRQYRDAEQYRRYYARSGLVWNDTEFATLINMRREQQQRYRKLHLDAVIDVAKIHGLPIASHDDTTLSDVHDAHRIGASFAEFPTTLEAAVAAHELGLAVIAGAPNLVRGGSHSGNVAAIEFARQECLDVLSSDFVPASLLHGAFVLAKQANWPLPRAIATVTQTPARALGFTDRGALIPGLRADLIRVRLVGTHPIVVATWVCGERQF